MGSFPIRYRLPIIMCGLLLAVVLAYGTAAYRQVEDSAVEAAGIRVGQVAEDLAGILANSASQLAENAAEVAADPLVQQHLREPSLESADAVREALLPSSGRSNLMAVELRDAAGRRLVESRQVEDFELEGDGLPASFGVGDEPVSAGRVRAMPSGAVVPFVARVLGPDGVAGHVVHWYRLVQSAAGRRQLESLIGSDAHLYLGDVETGTWTDLIFPATAPPTPLTGEREVVEYTREGGEPQIAAATPVAGTPWTVLVESPRAAAVAPALEMLPWLVLFGGVLLVVAGGAAWAVSRRMTGPLDELATAAGAISAGDYGRRVEIEGSDELGALASAFNAMAGAVENAHDTLEHKVTQLGRMEASHREVSERLHHVITSSPSVIYARPLNRENSSLSWISENVRRVLGYEPTEAMAEGWWVSRLHPEDRELLAMEGVHDHTMDSVREYRFLTSDGRVRWLRDEQRILRNSAGEPVEIVGVLSDITDRRQLEEQFRRSQKMEAVGRLAGGVAHDFNNLLTVILGEAEMGLAELGSEADEPTRDAFEQVRSAGQRATHLTRQLLAFSSSHMVETTAFEMNEVVRDVHTMLRRLIGEDVELELRISDEVGTVQADRGQIEQVLLNLVVNARDAMPSGGRMIIETGHAELDEEYASRHGDVATGEYVVLSVSDNGEGMSKEVKTHLFEPFFTTKPAGKGTGLGLATCYAIARRFGGHIEAYSEVGVGTTMKVYLPRSDQKAGEDTPAASERPSGGHERILVVEDDEQVRAITLRILKGQGYDVLEARDGEEAAGILEEEGAAVDLLLTDVVMPRMGGRELASRARSLRPELRVLFASGYSDEVVVQNRLLEDGMSLVQKPFTRDTLTRKVRDALDRPVTWA